MWLYVREFLCPPNTHFLRQAPKTQRQSNSDRLPAMATQLGNLGVPRISRIISASTMYQAYQQIYHLKYPHRRDDVHQNSQFEVGLERLQIGQCKSRQNNTNPYTVKQITAGKRPVVSTASESQRRRVSGIVSRL